MTMSRRRRVIVCGAAALFAVAALVAYGAIARGFEAALLLGDLAAGSGPSPLKSLTPSPTRSAVTYGIEGRNHGGDLYRPQMQARAALVLVPGALATGKDDPRLIAFATTLARAGFDVLAPNLPTVRALRLNAADAQDVADAVRYLSDTDGGRRLGIAALSYAAGPAIIAALDPAVGTKVKFILAIGGYYDTEAVLTFFTTGYYQDPPGGPWRHRPPNSYGKWLFVASNVDSVAEFSDRAILQQMADRKMADLSADIGDLARKLGPEGRAVYDLVDNADPARVPALIHALPEAVQSSIHALDLKTRNLSRLIPDLILVHGEDDAIIPESESKSMQAAAAPEKARLFLVKHLAHVDLKTIDTGDAIALWRAVYSLLKERDDPAAQRAD